MDFFLKCSLPLERNSRQWWSSRSRSTTSQPPSTTEREIHLRSLKRKRFPPWPAGKTAQHREEDPKSVEACKQTQAGKRKGRPAHNKKNHTHRLICSLSCLEIGTLKISIHANQTRNEPATRRSSASLCPSTHCCFVYHFSKP